MKWTIYSLADPYTGEIRYVGYTSQTLRKRLRGHIHHAKAYGRGAVRLWIMQLLADGLEPTIAPLEIGDGPRNWMPAERKWIAYYRGIPGNRLLNQSNGGQGVPGYQFSKESRRRISEKNKGRAISAEHKAKWHAAAVKANTGRHWSEEQKQKLRDRLTGVPRPPEVIAKFHAKNKGRVVSIETRQKLSNWRKGRTASDETKAKMSASHQKRFTSLREAV